MSRLSIVREITERNGASHRLFMRCVRPAASAEPLTSKQSVISRTVLNPGPSQTARDVNMDLPQNIGFGLANNALMDGRLLVGVDVLYKLYDEADLFRAVYDNQWVVQVGTQYSQGRFRLQAGYVWAQNPIDDSPGSNIGGVVQPGDLAAVRYTQGLLAITGQHRISFGVGMVDVLPGVDMDLMQEACSATRSNSATSPRLRSKATGSAPA